jgi:hypothetical protein
MTDTCPSCGAELDDGATRFCTSCGASLPAVSASEPAVVTEPSPAPERIAPPPPPIAPASEPVAAATEPADQAPAAEDIVVRRTRRTPFLPPAHVDEEEGGVVISRSWTSARRAAGSADVGRQRKIAGDLPSWEPLPPGEVVVARPRH